MKLNNATKTNILLTNDDGYFAKGLQTLLGILEEIPFYLFQLLHQRAKNRQQGILLRLPNLL